MLYLLKIYSASENVIPHRQRINNALELINNPSSNSLTIASISVDLNLIAYISFKLFVGKTQLAYRNTINFRFIYE